MTDERRQSPGRRAHDHVLQVIWRELDEMKKDMRRYLDELRGDLGDDVSRLDAGLAKFDKALGKLEDRLQERVTELETFHIQERTKAGERIAERASMAVRWQKVSIAFGVIGTCMGIVAVLVALIP